MDSINITTSFVLDAARELLELMVSTEVKREDLAKKYGLKVFVVNYKEIGG